MRAPFQGVRVIKRPIKALIPPESPPDFIFPPSVLPSRDCLIGGATLTFTNNLELYFRRQQSMPKPFSEKMDFYLEGTGHDVNPSLSRWTKIDAKS